MRDRDEVLSAVRYHLVGRGYDVSSSEGKYGMSAELTGKKGKDTFIVEAIGESSRKEADIIFALGKLVKRMSKLSFWSNYSIAMPRKYLKFLKNFEPAGLEFLKINFFLVGNYLEVRHLDSRETIEIIHQLRSGSIINPDLMDPLL